jgi:DNA-binding SARP family transcriptional activator
VYGTTDIRVLGPIDLVTGDEAVMIRSRNIRAVLGALVMSARHAVTVDRLAHAVWGDNPPPSVDSSVHSYISRLRHLVGADAVMNVDHSYVLIVEPDAIDAIRFERLLLSAMERRSEPAECLALCRNALRLWRGSAYGELGDEDPFRLEAMRLEELRMATMELSLECELELGRHELVMAELESLVEEYPYRERLWHLLITALLRDGRRVEAMRHCSRLREVLAEIGLEATNVVAELEAKIVGGAERLNSS